MRFVQRHAQALDRRCRRAEIVPSDRRRHPIEHDARQKLGRRVVSLERRLVVEIPEIQLAENRVEHLGRAADVDDDAVGVELGPAEFDVDDHRRAVQPLGRAEHVAL